MPTVQEIYRYPIKGLSPQALPAISLHAGKPFPFDRLFAMARPGSAMNAAEPRWMKKGFFLMLMLDESLAQVHTQLDVETLQLEIKRRVVTGSEPPASETLLIADLASAEGRAEVERFFERHVPELAGAPRLVRSPTGHFMDKPDNVMSCINLATVRELEKLWGHAVHPLRFRANFYIDGVPPWQEFEWLGREITLGGVQFLVDRRNGRCGATNVNPLSGARDLDIPGALRRHFGHKDLGVYLVARTSGDVRVGDRVVVPEVIAAPQTPASTSASTLSGTFICRGCYYLYDEDKGATGASLGTPFGALPEDWLCPDCGTGKSAFRARPLTELRPALPIDQE
jgi:GntR family transcriptional regulator / MocR family aminotransferase